MYTVMVVGEEQVIRSNCRICHGGCGVLVHVRDGRVVKVEGDPEFPVNRGSMCSKGLAVTQLMYHPDRITYPMKRAGKKGEGKWERISWDEALDTIAAKYKQIIKDYGPESIVMGQGTGREYEAFLYRFGYLLGTPNVITSGHECLISRLGATLVTCGSNPVVDYEGNPKCVMVWGANIVWSNPDEYKGENLLRVLSEGAKLIVVDPKLTWLSSQADVWCRVRPGTDAALALGMLNVIINEGLYDKYFVENYTHGWDKFVERVREYPVDRVEEITWVPAEKIEEAARLFAQTKPGAIQWGISIEHSCNCTDANRLLNDIMAITGNLDAPGGNIFFVPPKVKEFAEYTGAKTLSREQADKQLGGDRFKLAKRTGVVTPKMCWDAILTGKPYPVKAIHMHGSNPIVTRANAKDVYKALSKLEFLVVVDYFLTPTAELADIFLPCATYLEFPYIGGHVGRHGYIWPRRKIVEVGECWADHKILLELGKRMGQKWHDTIEEEYDDILLPGGVTWNDIKDLPYLKTKNEYRKYETKGFSTPTKKVELYSTTFERWGYDPLPKYRELPESPVSKPELAKEYPYILSTGCRSPLYFHAEHRMIPWLREIQPDPIVEISPLMAEKHGVKEGDWIYIESPRGRIKQKVRLNIGMDPTVVIAQHGWWYPEIKTPDHGWDISNANVLTDNDPATYDVAMGATNLRASLCKIYPVSKEDVD
jgi:anaerobic selenocysteine-containing dehydrogenase